MRIRPLQFWTIFFFVLVTTVGTIPDADAEERVGKSRRRGGVKPPNSQRPSTPFGGGAPRGGSLGMDESLGGPADSSEHEPGFLLPREIGGSSSDMETASASPRGGAGVRCNLEGSPLSPQLEQLVGQFCPPENAGQAGYCACVKGYIASNNMGAIVQAREDDMHRIGYQFFLEDWAKRYGASLLAFGSLRPDLQGADVLKNMPQSCKPGVMMSGILSKIGDVNECRGDIKSFSKALNKYFRLDGVSEISTLSNATDQDWSQYIARSTDFNRFYVKPGVLPGEIAQRDFIDCMSPSEKRAYALLPVAWNLGSLSNPRSSATAEAMRRATNLINIRLAVSTIQQAANPVDALKSSPEIEKIRSVLDIFPGMENLLLSGSLSKVETGEVLTSLQSFLTEIQHPDFRNMKEAKVSKDLMDRMTAAVNSVKGVVNTKLQSIKGDFDARLNQECLDLSKDLEMIACQPEDFTHSTDFMRVAFADAASKGTRSYAGEPSPPNFWLCSSTSERLGRATTEELAACMGYHSAQCDSKLEQQNRNVAESPQVQFSSMANRDLTDTKSLNRLIAERNAAQSLLAAEEGVVHTMCEGFNQYLNETKCSTAELLKRGPEAKFRDCAVDQNLFTAYLADGGDDKVNHLNGLNDGSRIGAALNGITGSGNNPRRAARNSEDTLLTQPETVASTVSVDNTSSVSRTISTGMTTPNTGISTVSVPLDIDSPAEIRAAIEQREQVKEAKNTEIANVDKELSELGIDSESARLRTELESLRAEMVAERDRNIREIAELRNRPNAPEAIARNDENSADDGETVATNRKSDARSSGIAASAGNAQAQGFNIGGASRAPASEISNTGDFSKAAVSTNFATAGATRSGLIQASSSLPAVQSQDPNSRLTLRVGDASYPVSDVKSFVLPAGGQLVEADIMSLIRAQSGQIPLDAQNRAFVEIRDPSNNSSMVVYVRITGSEIEFLDANQPPAEGPGVRATLLQLESLLGAVRD